MNLTQIKIILLFAFLFGPINGNSEKRCIGEDPAVIPDGCIIIEAKPLVFKDTSDVDLITEKMKTVRHVEHGVEVVGTDLENFSFLDHVMMITNQNGPALMFKDNKKLKRITMTSLRHIIGKDVDIVFDNDNFPLAAKESKESYSDLRHLQKIAHTSHNLKEICASNFLKVARDEPSGSGWPFYAAMILCVLAGLLLIGNIFFHCRNNRKAKKAIGKEKKEEEGKNEKKPSKEKVEEKTPSAEKFSEKDRENPKNK